MKYSYIPLKPETKALLEERLGRSDTWDRFINDLVKVGKGKKVEVVEKEVIREVPIGDDDRWDRFRVKLGGFGQTSIRADKILEMMDKVEGE